MFDRFTDRARKTMTLARKEAQRFNREFIGTEHILLGLIREGGGVAERVLKDLGVDLEKVRADVEKNVQAGPSMITMGQLPFTPRAKKVLELAMEEANNLRHNYIGTEHLLLGLLREHDGVAARILLDLGLKIEDVRARVISFLDPIKAESEAPSNRFSGEMHGVLDLACDEAKLHHEGLIDVGHIFLGMLAHGSRLINDFLRTSGIKITLEMARSEVQRTLGEAPPSEAGQLEWCRRRPAFLGLFGKMETYRFTKDAEKLIARSEAEANASKSLEIDVEHVLLALLGDEAALTRILFESGGNIEKLRGTLIELMSESRLANLDTRDFGRFTDRSKKAMALARKEAQWFNNDFIGPEHIFIGLIQEGSGIAANVLRQLGVELDKVRGKIEVDARPAPSTQTLGQIPFTPAAKEALDKSFGAADQFGDGYIGTEHLLLGLLRVESEAITHVLTDQGLTSEEVRKEVLELLGKPAGSLAQTREIELVDSARKVRARLSAARDGSPAIELLDQNGIARLSLALAADGAPVIEFRDPSGKVVSTLSPPPPPPAGV